MAARFLLTLDNLLDDTSLYDFIDEDDDLPIFAMTAMSYRSMRVN